MPRVIRFFFKLLSPLASGFICSSYRTFDYYSRYWDAKKPSTVIYPPVDVVHFDPEALRSETFATKDKVIIGTLCNINPTKNIELILRLASCLKARPNISFRIAGPVYNSQRRYFSRLQCLVRDLDLTNVEFVGNVSDVRLFLSQVDIYICSSLHESGPMSLFEAMSMGKPVLTTDVGDVCRYFEENVCGYIIKASSDVSPSVGHLIKLASNKELRYNMGKRSRSIAIEYFDVRKSASEHKKFYFELCR